MASHLVLLYYIYIHFGDFSCNFITNILMHHLTMESEICCHSNPMFELCVPSQWFSCELTESLENAKSVI